MTQFTDRLDDIAAGRADPADVLAAMSPADLTVLLEPRFPGTALDGLRPLGRGVTRCAGDAAGVLALDRDTARRLHRSGVPYVYAVDHGDARDFAAIRHAVGFVTPNPAPTVFAPVQAVSEDLPTMVGLTAETHTEPDSRRALTVRDDDGVHALGVLPVRALRFTGPGAARVEEGEWISVSATRGEVYRGRLRPEPSLVARFHRLVEEIVEDAVASGHHDDPTSALADLPGCPGYAERAGSLRELAAHPTVRGFDELRRLALTAPLSVFATAHTTSGVLRARLLTGRIIPEEPYVQPHPVPVGLLRDERMWEGAESRELLQLIVLGPDVLGAEAHAEAAKHYLALHGERIHRLLRSCRGALVVARTPCMPMTMIFPSDFDSDGFSRRNGLDPGQVRHVIALKAVEREVYHGWRGMRVFSQRPDIAELWLRAVLGAVLRAHEAGDAPRLRLLLATITFPAEAQRFLTLLEAVTRDVLGERTDHLDGVSIMVETTSAYVVLEDFLAARGTHTRIDGGLFGSNDLTAALLNFNRDDASRTIIPGYVANGMLPHSPFEHIETSVVGRCIRSAMDRSRSDERGAPEQTWGFGGELAGDWATVQWLATHVEPLGMRYVTTSPRRMLYAAFAAAQAAHADGRLVGATEPVAPGESG